MRDVRAGVIVLFAFGLIMIVGVGALAVDMSYLYVLETQLQTAADSAALAGASRLPDQDAARTEAKGYAEKNLPPSVHGTTVNDGDVVFGQWDTDTRTFTAGLTPANALQVNVLRTQSNGNAASTFLARIFSIDEVDVSATSMATGAAGKPGCIMALDPAATRGAMKFNSIDSADLDDCVPVANSTHSRAIEISSLDSFYAGSLYTSGGYKASSIDNFDLDEPAQTYEPPLADPYANLAEPSPGACDWTNHHVNSSGTISPGVYCGGLSVNAGSITFNPGTYYIVDGDLEFNSISNVSCNCSAPGSGVTFVLTGTSSAQIGTFSFGSMDSISLQSPSDPSYDYPGMLIYVDRDAPYDTSSFSSIDSLTFNGAVYAPSQKLQISSIDYSAQTDCAQLVAFRVQFSSIDSFGRADNCPAYGTKNLSIGGIAPALVM